MDISYWTAGICTLAMIILIIWLIKRNRKDEKVYEKEIIDSEIKPEKHDNEE
ncbi:heme exporter protein CcmD [Pedobacter sp. PAMC26386]|nr:heme exporter protein CcmD [Pedobacter sp. PAMC26386]